MPVPSTEMAVSSSPIEKGKGSRTVQQEKEVLPAIPSGLSLGDSVFWMEESANHSSSPAWSADSKKLPKPTCLRDIQKEQEKEVTSVLPQNQIPIPQKPQPTQATHGSGSSWSLSASSPSKAASPIQMNSRASSQSKYKLINLSRSLSSMILSLRLSNQLLAYKPLLLKLKHPFYFF